MAAAGGQDDQRLVGEVTEGGSLLRRGRRLEVLVDRAAKRACRGDAGADLVSGPWRQVPKSDWAYRRARPSRAEAETSAETRLMPLEEPLWPGDGVPGFAADAGAVESTSTMPATSSG